METDEGNDKDEVQSQAKPFVIHLELVPKEEMKRLPTLFVAKYSNTIPKMVALRDPTGHVINIKTMRNGDDIYLHEGWHKLVSYYDLYDGGWVKMYYVSLGLFDIHIQNVYDVEITYPEKQDPINFGCSHPPRMIYEGVPIAKPVNPSKFVRYETKFLEFEEVLGNKLRLSKDFCLTALPKKDGNITIIDENSKAWPCHMVDDLCDPGYCSVIGGWDDFCSEKRLITGSLVKFGVLTYNSSLLYYVPICEAAAPV